MGYRESRNEILELIEANYPFVYVVTEDENPVIKTYSMVAEKLEKESIKSYDVFTWNMASGIFCEYGKSDKKGFFTKEKNWDERVNTLLQFIEEHEGDAIFVLQDFDYILKNFTYFSYELKGLIQTITKPIHKDRQLKRNYRNQQYDKHIVIVSSNQFIPKELDKLVNLVYFSMPGREDIKDVIEIVSDKIGQKISDKEMEELITASLGLTEPELVNALYKSTYINEDGRLNPKDIIFMKEQIIRKGDLVEFITPKNTKNELGGLKKLMDWVKKREMAFNEEIRVKKNLSYPKGILLTGVQGCGKSHAVKAISEFFGIPLIRLDMGKLMGKYLGDSEENLRKAISLAEAVAPCVLWIDEVEKGISDPRSPNTHEASNKMLAYFLNWLQEKESAVFVAATANNIDSLPPELMRKGRFSEIFFVNLPSPQEREEIFKIHLKKLGVNTEKMDLSLLISKTHGFSGAEIEELVGEANYQSAYDSEMAVCRGNKRIVLKRRATKTLSLKKEQLEKLKRKLKPLLVLYILKEIERTTPMSVIRSDRTEAIRKWAKDNKVREAN